MGNLANNNKNFIGSLIFGIDEHIETVQMRIFSHREGCLGKEELLEACERAYELVKNFIEKKL